MKIRGVSIFKPNGKRKATDPYKIAYGFGSKRKVVTASTDYADTVEYAKRLSKLVQASELGLADPNELRRETQRRRPLSEHLNDWEKEMKARGQTPRHALRMRLYAEQCLDDVVSVDAVVLSNVRVKIAGLGGSSTTRPTLPANLALRRERNFAPINGRLIPAGLPDWAALEPDAEPYTKPKTAWHREMRERRERREGEK